MLRRIGFAAVLCTLLGAGSASAALQPPITVLDKQWLQPLDFINTSWTSINTVCNEATGACNGSLNGNDLTGWTWANVDDVNALFNHYWYKPGDNLPLGPGPDGDSMYCFCDNYDSVADMMADGFLSSGDLGSVPWDGDSHGITGWLRTSVIDVVAYVGSVGFIETDLSEGLLMPGIAGVSTGSGEFKGVVRGDLGSWFYRDANTSVPVTNTLALLGLGLCALRFTARKRQLI